MKIYGINEIKSKIMNTEDHDSKERIFRICDVLDTISYIGDSKIIFWDSQDLVDKFMSYDLEAYHHVDGYLKLKHRSNIKTPLEIQVEGILKSKSLEYHHSRACLHMDMPKLMICIWDHMTIDELKLVILMM